MRKVFYVPKNDNIDDYKSQWENIYTEIQHGVSENTKDFIDNIEVAGVINIPEYRMLDVPINFSDREFLQFKYWDDFEVIKKEKPEVICEIYTNNLDNPSSESVLINTMPMHYLEQGLHWSTDFTSLEIGWYEIVVKVNGLETESRETSVYEYYLEEE